ncbi:drug/metabolite transporter (DMT)-like permease [Neobacillus niacini]|jgi:drug/metabolite transporter (DMT)-like permease|nr:drug/metabolite transporter (DMT)-like permease [Neobacillus niacini]
MKLSKKEWLFLCIAGVFLAMHFTLWFESLKLTTVASSTIILTLQPIVALLGGFLIYKERTSISTLMAIGISIIGVVMVGWGDFGLSNKSVIIGDVLSFLSVLSVVGYLLIGQNNVKKISHWIYSFCVFLFAGLSLNGYSDGWGVFVE